MQRASRTATSPCVFAYTDASERHWSSIITQVPHADLELPHADQSHAPLAFLSGSFVGAPFRWSIADKEGFAIMHTCQRLDYLLRCPAGFSLFSDHRNLIYIFDPRGHNPGLAQHSEARLLRWALKLSSYHYVIEYIAGSDNVGPTSYHDGQRLNYVVCAAS
jgi:RNase H-like domain found in reverse transcriptase